MRAEAYAAAALILLMLAPAATGALTVKGELPARSVLFAPQLHCEVVYEVPGVQRCDVYGGLQNVNELRLRMVGQGEVFAFLDDVTNPEVLRQLAVLDCVRSCVTGFRLTSAQSAALYIYTAGERGATMSVTVGRGIGTETL